MAQKLRRIHLLEKHHNTYRLMMLDILLAHIYNSSDHIDQSIKTAKDTLKRLVHSAHKPWFKTLHFNLSWSYMYKHDYHAALDHAFACEHDYQNCTIYFMIAFCYYKLKDLESSITFIEKARKAKFSTQFYEILVDWLDVMINNPYQRRCIHLLLHIYNHKHYELDLESENAVLSLIVDYYEHKQDIKSKRYYLNKMQLKHTIIPLPSIDT